MCDNAEKEGPVPSLKTECAAGKARRDRDDANIEVFDYA